MAVTYAYPSYSEKDAVRFLISDTSTSEGKLQDAEIDWLLQTWGSVYRAAAEACRVLASKVIPTDTAAKSVGPLSISRSGATTQKYLDLAEVFEKRAQAGIVFAIAPYSGGISKADKELTRSDDDWDRPWFSRGMHDYPGTNASVTTSPLNSPST
jgi:hypothetical protein